MIYLDACALVKLVVDEAESAALKRFLGARPDQRRVSTTLVRTEVVRAIRRATTDQELHAAARELIARLHYVELTKELLDTAGETGDPALRTLDAIHLEAARTLGPYVTTFVTYDLRLAKAAEEAKLPVAAPA